MERPWLQCAVLQNTNHLHNALLRERQELKSSKSDTSYLAHQTPFLRSFLPLVSLPRNGNQYISKPSWDDHPIIYLLSHWITTVCQFLLEFLGGDSSSSHRLLFVVVHDGHHRLQALLTPPQGHFLFTAPHLPLVSKLCFFYNRALLSIAIRFVTAVVQATIALARTLHSLLALSQLPPWDPRSGLHSQWMRISALPLK